MKTIIRLIGIILCAALLTNESWAFSSQPATASGFPPERIIAFAKQVEKALAAQGARVAIVARIGRPLNELPEGMRYTHTGFAVYSRITTADHRVVPGYAMYNLYQSESEPDRSSLVQDFPADFFSGVQLLEAGVVIPSPELQERLLGVIQSPTYVALHSPRYSAIANPFNLALQNCTEYVLDVVFAAIYATEDPRQIKANEQAYFVPQPVKVNSFKLLLGSIFTSDIAISDQNGPPVTATFSTIASFLEEYDNATLLTITERVTAGSD